ncbi:MAG: C40 family peptidase [Bacillota bacterium]
MRRLSVLTACLMLMAVFYFPSPAPASQGDVVELVLSGMIVPAADLEGVQIPKEAEDAAVNTEVSRSTAGSDDARMVIKKAMSLIGSKYRYGGEGPDSFDCSGFTKYVFKSVGINLPHIAADQADMGVRVSKNDLIPGDLVFFGYYGSKDIQHVGIYIGNNEFIHASNSRYNVTITSLGDTYYENNYKGARRLIR